MNRINFPLLFAAMTVGVVMSAPSLAQDGQKGMGRNMPSFADFDLNGDGIAERPFRPNSVADQIIWRNPKAKILVNSPILQILQWAQSRFPALHPGGVQDSFPLMQPLAQNSKP